MRIFFTSSELAQIVSALSIKGSTAEIIRSISALEVAQSGDLSFLGNAKYRMQVAASKASVILVPKDFEGEPQTGQQYLLVENPSSALALICARIEQSLWPKPTPGIHASAVVSPSARIAASATVGPLCIVEEGAEIGERVHLQAQVFVGAGAKVGDDSWLMPSVVLAAQCELGQRVRLQPGVVIGADGFGYEFVNGRHEKIPQVGIVLIQDDVEIGANSNVDRARFSRTVIGQGTKIDNLVQIGHNVIMGKHCILCAQVGISGSTNIEDYVVLAGQAGVGGHITIGKGSKIGGQSAVSAGLPAGSYVNGSPAMPFQLERRIAILRQRLPDLFRRVDALETQIKNLPK